MKKEVAEVLKKPEVAEKINEGFVAIVASVLKDSGVEFTSDDILDFFKGIGGKLSDDELENIAGGFNFSDYDFKIDMLIQNYDHYQRLIKNLIW